MSIVRFPPKNEIQTLKIKYPVNRLGIGNDEAKKNGMGYGMLKEQVSSARKIGLAVKEAQARIDKKVLLQGI